MNDHDEQIVVTEMITSIALDVLARLEGDPEARFVFFKGFVELAKKAVTEQLSQHC